MEWINSGANRNYDPPVGVDARNGQKYIDGKGIWIYDKATTTWLGKNGAKNIANTIELANVNVKGYKSNYVSSGEYGPDKDFGHAVAFAGTIVIPVLGATGGLSATGAYLYSEGVAAFSQIIWGSAATNMTSNATAQYLANGGNFGDINMISTACSVVPGIGPAAFGETFSLTFNKGFKTPESGEMWAVQAGSAVLSNRFGKVTDNYLSGGHFGEAIVREYFKGIIAVGANSSQNLVKK